MATSPPKPTAMPDGVDAFGLKFKEATEALKSKIPEATLRWDDLAGPVHGKVFAVAGATQASLLNDLHQALISAKENGTTLTEFRKAFDKTVQAHGWAYNGERGWRTQLIFGANMRSSAMAGKWQQLQAGKKRTPFLQYRTAGDGKVRPMHRAWNSVIRPIDDPFWQTHYPPNGWNCRCTVRAYSQRELDAKGLKVDTEPFQARMRNVTNKDGEVIDIVPEGIDPGWDHNVGISAQAPEVALGRKLKELPRELRDTVVEKSISPAYQQVLDDGWKGYRTNIKGRSKPAQSAHVVGYLDGKTLSGVEEVIGKKAGASFTSGAVGVSGNVTKTLTPDATGWPQAELDKLPSHIRNYDAVLWDTQQEMLHILPQEGPASNGKVGVIKLALQPGRGNLNGAMAVQGVSVERIQDLSNDRYKVLLGQLPQDATTPLSLAEFTARLERSGMLLDDNTTANYLHKASGGLLDPEAIAKAMTGSDGKGLWINSSGTAVMIAGDGVTIYGAKGCNIERTFSFADKQRYVLHSLLEIPKDEQGAGAVKAMMRAALPEYERMGIERIKLYANLDVGGYAWARYGFTPAGGAKISSEASDKLARLAKATDLTDPAKAELQALQSAYSQQEGGAWVSLVAHAKTPALDAYLRADGSYGDPAMPGGLTAAKALLLNSGWRGELLLSDDAAMQKLRSYINASP